MLALDPQFHGTKATEIWRTTGVEAQLGIPQEPGPLTHVPLEKISVFLTMYPTDWVLVLLLGEAASLSTFLTGLTAVALVLAEQAKLLGPV